MNKRSLRQIWKSRRSLALACVAAAAIAVMPGSRNVASAKDKYTVAYIAPSLDISYWQWVAYGAKTQAAELGMEYVELTSENSPGTQMNNVRTALTRGVNAIVMGPVSSASTPPVLRFLKQKHVPIAFTGIGPQPGETDYTSSVTANNYETGKAEGSFVCKLAKERAATKLACCLFRKIARMHRST
jgi:ribose transport system substrate-binding protein